MFLDFLLLHSSPVKWKGHLSWLLVLKGVVGLHRTVQLQLLQNYWLGPRLGLLWYWMICLGNEQRSFCHFWDCIQVLHFGLFCSKFSKPGFSNTWTMNFQIFKLVLEKAEEEEIKLPTYAGSSKMQETRAWSLDWEEHLEKAMATHPSVLAWEIPWTEEPGGLQSKGSQRVGHDWVT